MDKVNYNELFALFNTNMLYMHYMFTKITGKDETIYLDFTLLVQ